MENLFVVGTGSQARYVIENMQKSTSYLVAGLVDIEKKENIGKKINGIEIVCLLDDILKYFDSSSVKAIIAYGDNYKKKEIANYLESKNFSFATILNPNIYKSSFVEIGEGTIINANVTIMPNTKIGSHVIIHSGSVIEHDNIIGDYVNIAPGVVTAGQVRIGEGSYVYTNACIVPKVTIGKWSIVGAGSVVLKDVENNVIVAGNPAKIIGTNNKFF
jgi:acetyltransferase EpsM